MFANTSMMGMDITFPDICKTPPVAIPIPYPNFAPQPLGLPPCFKVIMAGAPAHNMKTKVVISFGDTPGLMGGIISNTVMGPSRKIVPAFLCLTQGLPTNRMLSITLQNRINMIGITLVPSQLKVIVLK